MLELCAHSLVFWKLFEPSDAEMGKKIKGRLVEEAAKVFFGRNFLNKSADEEVADDECRIDSADVIYLPARYRASVDDDGKCFKPRLAEIITVPQTSE